MSRIAIIVSGSLAAALLVSGSTFAGETLDPLEQPFAGDADTPGMVLDAIPGDNVAEFAETPTLEGGLLAGWSRVVRVHSFGMVQWTGLAYSTISEAGVIRLGSQGNPSGDNVVFDNCSWRIEYDAPVNANGQAVSFADFTTGNADAISFRVSNTGLDGDKDRMYTLIIGARDAAGHHVEGNFKKRLGDEGTYVLRFEEIANGNTSFHWNSVKQLEIRITRGDLFSNEADKAIDFDVADLRLLDFGGEPVELRVDGHRADDATSTFRMEQMVPTMTGGWAPGSKMVELTGALGKVTIKPNANPSTHYQKDCVATAWLNADESLAWNSSGGRNEGMAIEYSYDDAQDLSAVSSLGFQVLASNLTGMNDRPIRATLIVTDADGSSCTSLTTLGFKQAMSNSAPVVKTWARGLQFANDRAVGGTEAGINWAAIKSIRLQLSSGNFADAGSWGINSQGLEKVSISSLHAISQ